MVKMIFPCGYPRHVEQAKKFNVKPLSHAKWHEWWERHFYLETVDIQYARSQHHYQRMGALQRGIGWHFTFEGWVNWWEEQLGDDWQKKRGCRADQYVMARKGDKGPYRVGNVECVLSVQNTHDMVKNGYDPHGEKCGYFKLTDAQVREIYTTYDSNKEAALKFGVHQRTIAGIRCRLNRTHATEGLERKPILLAGESHWNSRLTDEQVIMIFKSKLSSAKLAKKYNVVPQTINCIRKRLSWTHITKYL